MLRGFNIVLVIVALTLGFVLYSLEHRIGAGEHKIARLKHEVAEERESIRLLQAEWSHLSRPSRIERLAREHAGMEPLSPGQVMSRAELGRLPDRPAPNPAESPDDPLADLLQVLQ